jgi:3-keto-L-gulonate-6-phosphate decarboxylase
VSTTTGCSWSASDIPAWMTVSTGTITGSGGLPYSVAENTGPARSATIVVAGRSIVVSQAEGTNVSAPVGFRIDGGGQ